MISPEWMLAVQHEVNINALRREIEMGHFRLRVCKNEAFRQELSSIIATCLQEDPYCEIYYYCDPVTGKLYQLTEDDIVTPWEENLSWRIVLVSLLISEDIILNEIELVGDELKKFIYHQIKDEIVVTPFGR